MTGDTSAGEPAATLDQEKPPDANHIEKSIKMAELPKINAVYYPNYRVYRGETPASLNYNCTDRIYYAFANLSSDGFVFLSDELADKQMEVDGARGCLGSFMQLKKAYPHLRVLLSVGGAKSNGNFASVANSIEKRDNFAKSATELVKECQLDGLDIYWDYPSDEQQGHDFLALLKNIREYSPEKEFIVTSALQAGHWALKHINLKEAAEYLSQVNLISYDFAGTWRSTAGHNAQLHPAREGEMSGAAAVEYIRSMEFPGEKILLGIPVYGRSFIGAAAAGDKYWNTGGDGGIYEYKALPRPGTVEEVDLEIAAAYCVGGDGGFVTYDNPATVSLKGQYCKEQNLGGLFFWTGTGDVSNSSRSLIAAGYAALHGS